MSEELSGEENAGEVDKRVRRLTDGDYAKIKEFYELGTKGLTELATEFGVSRQAVSKRFKDDGVIRGSRSAELASALKTAAVASTVATAAPAPKPPAERYHEHRELWIEETRVDGYKALRQVEILARKTIAEALRASKTPAAVDEDLKAVQRFNKILVDNIESRMRILDAAEFQSEEDLPSLMLEDLTDEDILEHHKNIGALPEDAELKDLMGEVGDLDIGSEDETS